MKPSQKGSAGSEQMSAQESAPVLNIQQAIGLGLQLQNAGQFETAQEIYEALLQTNPVHPEALHLRGTLEHAQKNHVAALEFYHRAIEAARQVAANYFNVGLVRLAMFDLDGAIGFFKKAVELAPHDPRCYDGLGYAFRMKGEFGVAAQNYAQGLICDPCAISIILNFASTLHCARFTPSQKFEIETHLNTLSSFAQMLEQHGVSGLSASGTLAKISAPTQKSYVFHYSLGLLFGLVGNGHKAALQFDKAACLRPESAECFLRLGKMLMQLKRTQEAIDAHILALQVEPANKDALFTLGYLYAFSGEYEKAHELLLPVLESSNVVPQTQYFLATLYLARGDYLKGFETYEYRRKFVWAPYDDTLPYWQGEPVEGKNILLTCEQGYGDCIQFVRYAQTLFDRGAKVHVWAYPPLAQIFKSISFLHVYQEDESLPEHLNWQCPLHSVPYYLKHSKADVPARIPYLFANAERLAKLDLGPRNGNLRIGICWAGNVAHALDAVRSCPLSAFRGLFEVAGCEFFSFQRGNSNFGVFGDIVSENVVNVEPYLQDFADTAALLSQMDLLITVDSGIAHLAGALGIATWILLSKEGVDWRWQTHPTASLWYPSVRLFRQSTQDDWAGVVDQVKLVLRS